MPITKQLSSLSNVKQLTGADSPQNPSALVTYTYGPTTSTASQTVINLGFSVVTSNTSNFFLYVDGKLLSIGASNDYTFTNVQVNGTSSQVTLHSAIPSGLNINATYLGVLVPTLASTSVLTINSEIQSLQPAYSLKTINYTLQYTDRIVQFNCNSGSLIATLPDATIATVGQMYEVCRSADGTPSNTLTVNTTAGQTIGNRFSGSIKLQPSDYIVVISDGTNWQLVESQEIIAVNYTYVATATGVPNNSSTPLNATYGTYTKVFDTHSAFSNGTFTVPASGKYRMSVGLGFVANTTGVRYALLTQGGSSSAQYVTNSLSGFTGTTNQLVSSATFLCVATDTLTVQAFQNSGAPLAIGGTSTNNYVCIERIGD
jgi:hypothetical protein